MVNISGMDPNWRHIIPPGQRRVVSEGQCVEDCTGYAFPPQGIKIFAVMMRTHQIGREIKLRQVRKRKQTFYFVAFLQWEKFFSWEIKLTNLYVEIKATMLNTNFHFMVYSTDS